ncbi:hypothetical protein CB0940_00297 [Cercospora beticola]|uniref:Apple domain-containing protein n=1 Tax=Cercospora beticola TaxID=122368 RepID=A0A2G5IAS2_CERBT|nr:hypothetical protein CB0940_00297 [Cercospora beticola]PIB01782.1 hypothetical protein CB0940_00297 [Cercospora beticola]WPA95707.1 hypothetical protein RHO25_000310 [Cercospora beticola]CAK1356047.1 unnamed protein product [Cercospora beticola]
MYVPDLTSVAEAIKQALNTTTLLPSSHSPHSTEEAQTGAETQTAFTTWLGRSRVRGRRKASVPLDAMINSEKVDSASIATEEPPNPTPTEASLPAADVSKRQLQGGSVIVGAPVSATRTTTIKSTSVIERTTTVNGETRTTSSDTVATVTRTVTESQSSSTGTPGTTASASLTGTSTANASTPVSTVTAPLATPPPECPQASLDRFTDSAGIPYLIKCSTTNAGAAYELVKVDRGGYGQCFSSCSYRADCVGFSFVGNDSGICYLRNEQSSGEESTALVASYVTCYKVDPAAVASGEPKSDSSSGGTNIGAIAGGVVGGIAGLALLLLLIAFLTRRYRRKVDERREKRKVGRPMLSPQDTYDGFHHNPNVTTVTAGLHQRSGSTANDVYMSAGGFQRPSEIQKSADPFGNVPGDHPYGAHASRYQAYHPGSRAENDGAVLRAGALRYPQMLDGTPVASKSSLEKSGSRSSVFVEHMIEMEDTSARRSPVSQESPILGRQNPPEDLSRDVRRNQHILAWNRPEGGNDAPMSANLTPRTPPSARLNTPRRSSVAQDLPRQRSFEISPLRDERPSPRQEPEVPETLGSGVYRPV